MMRWLPRLNPLTRKRLVRFRRSTYGYVSLFLLSFLFFLSLFSEFIANNRAIVVSYDGQLYFPTFKFHPMSTFGQEDEFGASDTEADYRRMEQEFARPGNPNWVLMPPVVFNPIENDFSYDEAPPTAPDILHPLGTDATGRDVFARLLYGFRTAMLFSLALTLAGTVIGVVVGALQGFFGGLFDLTTQRFVEIWSTLPFLYIVIVIGMFIPPSFTTLLLITAAFQWIGITYYLRAEMYREKAREYCLAARAMGASPWRILFVHLIPNCLTPVITLTPFAIVGGIFSLTALDFLGYGLPAPTPSWGELIDQALQSSNRDKLWLTVAPFTAISLTMMLVTLIGEAVREAFDPRAYSRYR